MPHTDPYFAATTVLLSDHGTEFQGGLQIFGGPTKGAYKPEAQLLHADDPLDTRRVWLHEYFVGVVDPIFLYYAEQNLSAGAALSYSVNTQHGVDVTWGSRYAWTLFWSFNWKACRADYDRHDLDVGIPFKFGPNSVLTKFGTFRLLGGPVAFLVLLFLKVWYSGVSWNHLFPPSNPTLADITGGSTPGPK